MSRMGVSTVRPRRDGSVIEGETVPDPHPSSGADRPGSASGPVIIAGEIEDGSPRKPEATS